MSHSGDEPSTKTKLRLAKKLANELLSVADGLLTPPGCIGLKNHTCLSTADHETQGTSTAMSIIRNQECKSIDLGLTPELLGLV